MQNIIAENDEVQGARTGYLTSIAENTNYVFPTLDEATAKQIMGEDVYADWTAKNQEFYAENQEEVETDEPEATQTDAEATKTDADIADERGALADAELGTDGMATGTDADYQVGDE
jgi:hypothetical protein